PGPTPVPPEVLQAGAQPMFNHRGKEFAQLIQRTTARLKELFRTKNDLFILTGSGTGALEASIVNTLSPGDRVLAVSIGEFGERYTDIARAFGADVIPLKYEMGLPADPDDIRQAIRSHAGLKAVMVTHNETSTGVTNDIKAIGAVVREADLLFLVDSVSGIGSLPYPVDEWGGDVVATASQKGWMAPPGLAMVSVSARAWEAHKQARMPRSYWDFSAARSYLERDQTPWTPALSVLFALDKGIELMIQEGLENVHARHARVGGMIREGVRAMGLSILPKEERYASNTVTAVWPPEGVKAPDIMRAIREERDIELAGGQGSLSGKIFRIGHLGWVTEADARSVLDGLKAVLPKVGYKAPAAAGR
ncbi:MAG: alanine--glyoxylate aminotransferase family protein, partial [Chloroflexi bacterium]|nr:alanine--glyoxylate aminotransferase family protein [Chloroflexota bacterium]